ncbi:MAG: 4-hydroxy-3-methylbut-2-enyl diphosphate reductase [Verrucomicrobiota bacterium]|nr:4-hydroxy-3-methylbut-2-enyl diphosphate reductase [Verrucomicrobiota bacterium]
MKIIRAEHLGMCFGVRDAIALAKEQAKTDPLTILGELVHNETVLSDLRAVGIKIEKELSNVTTSTVMITAHGASDRMIKEVAQGGHNVLEATCPLVHYAHRSLKKLVEAGYHPVVIGKFDHVEVRGLTEDFVKCDVVLNAEDIENISERSRFGVISQTTQPIEKVRHLVDLLRQRFPHSEVRFTDTVCQPTKHRQTAAVDLAKKCEVVVVVGGAKSNNTKELLATCQKFCSHVYHIQSAKDLRAQWFENVECIGITAGTSTPDSTIAEVGQAMGEFSRKAKTEAWK